VPPGYDPATQFGVDGSGVTVVIADDGIGIPGDGGKYVTAANAVDGPLRGAPSGALGHGHLNATIVAGTAPFGGLDPLSYSYGLGIAPNRIDALQFPIQMRQSARLQLVPQTFPHGSVTGGDFTDSVAEHLEVEAGTAHHQGHLATRMQGRNDGLSVLQVSAGIKRLIRKDQVQEVVRHPRALFLSGFGSADVHVAINLHGIGIHDLGSKPFGQPQGQLGLPHPGGPGQKDQRRPLVGAVTLLHESPCAGLGLLTRMGRIDRIKKSAI
jgi:hypothetical protein